MVLGIFRNPSCSNVTEKKKNCERARREIRDLEIPRHEQKEKRHHKVGAYSHCRQDARDSVIPRSGNEEIADAKQDALHEVSVADGSRAGYFAYGYFPREAAHEACAFSASLLNT